MESMMVLL